MFALNNYMLTNGPIKTVVPKVKGIKQMSKEGQIKSIKYK